jgi:hypothetical protein
MATARYFKKSEFLAQRSGTDAALQTRTGMSLPYIKSPFLKGQCHKNFDLRFFHETIHPGPLIDRLKPFLNSASNSPRYDRFSNVKSATPHARKYFVREPL